MKDQRRQYNYRERHKKIKINKYKAESAGRSCLSKPADDGDQG